MLVLIYVKSNTLDDPNMDLFSTHKKATLKTASEAYGIDFLQCNSHLILHLLFPLAPFYSHTRELVFAVFSIFIGLLFFFYHLFFFTSLLHKPQIPRQSIVIVQGREEGVYFNQTQ